jgi:hypothetical protein
VRVLAVGSDAVAKIHAQRALTERNRVGAAERARPQGVGVDLFVRELEFFFRDAIRNHEVHPHAVTQGWMRRGRADLLELSADVLLPGSHIVLIH